MVVFSNIPFSPKTQTNYYWNKPWSNLVHALPDVCVCEELQCPNKRAVWKRGQPLLLPPLRVQTLAQLLLGTNQQALLQPCCCCLPLFSKLVSDPPFASVCRVSRNLNLFMPFHLIKGVACIWDVGCAYPEFAQYLARIHCPKDRCVHPSKWPFWLRASVHNKTLACIPFRNGPCVHPFSSH